MIAYKGFTKDLTATLGRGTYQFKLGETVKEESSKTIRSGFHCCENPFECLSYYPLGRENRYFQVEAAGSIDEDEGERIACTEMTLVKELSLKEFAGYGMMYIVQHPMREKWRQKREHICVTEDAAVAKEKGDIAIARGVNPVVKGAEGSILGVIVEPEQGKITGAKLFVVEREQTGKWYTLNKDRTLQEVEYEEKED